MSNQKLTDAEITELVGCGNWSLTAAEEFGYIKMMQQTVWAIRGTDAYNESLREAQYEEEYHERREVQE